MKNRKNKGASPFKKAVTGMLCIIAMATIGANFVDPRSGVQLVLICLTGIAGVIVGKNLKKMGVI
jgi:hypothetical protein